VISGIILPILPNRGYGPWETLNPRQIWLIVVLVAGLSFAGFVAVRLLGEKRGLAITGAAGGLVSSTAVSVSMADRSRETPSLARPAAAATILASAIMPLRVAFFAGLIAHGVLPRLLPACAAMALCGAIVAWMVAHGEQGVAGTGRELRNPFSLRQALVFAVIYGVIALGVRAVQEYLAAGAMFVAAALGSVADTDAVTIALARLGAGSAAWKEIAAAITLAAVTNTLVKLGIAWTRGERGFRRFAAGGLGSMAIVGAGAGAAVYLFA
jgi:uncharacterized membrane protein (DUF4010 family)